ncbi:MAG: MgtC/SapB family protein [Clostridiaceae bacterium]|nr:MgtC/SapB family protein [Clostridiaceae bacterium]
MFIDALDSLRALTPLSGMVRLVCAVMFGGLIGLERERKGRAAGFRTYMLVCLGASITMMLGQYEYLMVTGQWSSIAAETGIKTDVSRFGAQVINGVGFLGAGTIVVTSHRRVKGVTTAAGLWASACMGIAIGAGFYECMLMGFMLILLCFQPLRLVENHITSNSRNMNVYVEFDGMELLGNIFELMGELGVHVYDVEIDHGQNDNSPKTSAMLYLRLSERHDHAKVLAEVSKISGIHLVEEV